MPSGIETPDALIRKCERQLEYILEMLPYADEEQGQRLIELIQKIRVIQDEARKVQNENSQRDPYMEYLLRPCEDNSLPPIPEEGDEVSSKKGLPNTPNAPIIRPQKDPVEVPEDGFSLM